MEGSYTVEAAFVMVTVLMVLTGVLCLGLSLHDKAVIRAAAAGTVICADTDAEWAEEAAERSTLLPVDIHFTAEGSYGNRKISFFAAIKSPLYSFLSPFYGNGEGEIDGMLKYDAVDPVVYLRLWRLTGN